QFRDSPAGPSLPTFREAVELRLLYSRVRLSLRIYLRAACNPAISFCTFFRPSGSSSPPATEVSRPKICASPCQATLVPLSTDDKSNPAVSETFPPATLP